jgi:hypothetical protein
MRIRWIKIDGGYKVMLYLGNTESFIIPKERWAMNIFCYGIMAYGVDLIPIKELHND